MKIEITVLGENSHQPTFPNFVRLDSRKWEGSYKLSNFYGVNINTYVYILQVYCMHIYIFMINANYQSGPILNGIPVQDHLCDAGGILFFCVEKVSEVTLKSFLFVKLQIKNSSQ